MNRHELTCRKLLQHRYVLIFMALWALHILGGSPWWRLTYDSIFYATTTDRVAHGDVFSAIGTLWMPLLSWCAAPLTLIGLSPFSSILVVNLVLGLCGLMTFRKFLLTQFSKSIVDMTMVLFATTPLFVEQMVSIGSDALFFGLVTFTNFSFLMTPRPRFVTAVALAALPLARIPGIPVSVLLLGRLTYYRVRKIISTSQVLVFSLPFVFVILLLCIFFKIKLGIFIPSASFALNKFYLNLEWLSRDPTGWCRLYDGHHTVLGDLNYLSPLPTCPPIPSNEIWNYRLITIRNYLIGWGSVATIPVTVLSLYGYWIVRKSVNSTWLILTAIAATMGMVFTTAVPRYFLPALSIIFVFFSHALSSIKVRRTQALFFGLCLIANLALCSLKIPWRNIPQKKIQSAGQKLFEEFGVGRRIVTTENFISAVQSRGVWKYLPCVDATALDRYLTEQKVEFLVLPSHSVSQSVMTLLNQGKIKKILEFNNEIIFRNSQTYPE